MLRLFVLAAVWSNLAQSLPGPAWFSPGFPDLVQTFPGPEANLLSRQIWSRHKKKMTESRIPTSGHPAFVHSIPAIKSLATFMETRLDVLIKEAFPLCNFRNLSKETKPNKKTSLIEEVC